MKVELKDGTLVDVAELLKARDERDALAAQVEGLHRVLQGIASAPYDIEGYPGAKDQAAWMQTEAEAVLALTPSTALALHDAEVLERTAMRIEQGIGPDYAVLQLKAEAARIRAEAGREGE